MAERRYTDEEVGGDLPDRYRGAQSLPVRVAPQDGLSLAELEEVGGEVRISPEAVGTPPR
jgi:hypothetical protein